MVFMARVIAQPAAIPLATLSEVDKKTTVPGFQA
jgi:hypothetical protein